MPSSEQEHSSTPVHQRLSEDLRSALAEGRFKAGERMPTEAELAERYGVSRQTVRRAFQDLVSEGLVYRVPGKGTFPSSFPRPGHYLRSIGTVEDLQAFAGSEMELLQRIELRSDEEAAHRLELPSKVVAVLALRRLYEDLPFGLTHIYLPPHLGQRLAEDDALPLRGPGTVISHLERFLLKPIAGVNQIITSAPAPPDVAPLIDYEAGQHCMRIERTYFSTDGTPIELAISFYNPDLYTYQIQMRRRAT